MSMRVIAGVYRHRLLKYPENRIDIRPTKDRIRGAFFSSLGDINGKTFLDLYAGCGAMGIEAISRGAKESYFVDLSIDAIKYVNENIKTLDIKNAKVFHKTDMDALEYFQKNNIKFDIIYLDPPYESGLYESALSYIYNNGLLNNNSVVAFECNKPVNINPLWAKKIKEYHYGEITVTVLRN